MLRNATRLPETNFPFVGEAETNVIKIEIFLNTFFSYFDNKFSFELIEK